MSVTFIARGHLSVTIVAMADIETITIVKNESVIELNETLPDLPMHNITFLDKTKLPDKVTFPDNMTYLMLNVTDYRDLNETKNNKIKEINDDSENIWNINRVSKIYYFFKSFIFIYIIVNTYMDECYMRIENRTILNCYHFKNFVK